MRCSCSHNGIGCKAHPLPPILVACLPPGRIATKWRYDVVVIMYVCRIITTTQWLLCLCVVVQLLLRNVEELKLSHNKIKDVENLSVSPL